jgi:hypothetical protein
MGLVLRVWRGGSGWLRVLWEGSFALSISIGLLGRLRRLSIWCLDVRVEDGWHCRDLGKGGWNDVFILQDIATIEAK